MFYGWGVDGYGADGRKVRTINARGEIWLLIDCLSSQELLLSFDQVVVVGDELLAQDDARSPHHGVGHGAGICYALAFPGADAVC